MPNIDFYDTYKKIDPEKKDSFIKNEFLKYANQKGFYNENKKEATDKGKKVKTKDNILFIVSWKDLTKKQKFTRFVEAFSCFTFLLLFSRFLHISKDDLTSKISFSVGIAIVSIFTLTCIVSHISTIEDRKITSEVNEKIEGENKLSTTSIRAIIKSMKKCLTEDTFNQYLKEEEKPKTKFNLLTAIKELFQNNKDKAI